MRAAVMRNGAIVVDDIPEPTAGPGRVLVRTVACGICGSDLHFLKHGHRMVEIGKETGSGSSTLDLGRDVVMGHEFVGEVLDLGPEPMSAVKAGDLVVAMPVMMTKVPPSGPADISAIGYSNVWNGGYAERMSLCGPLLLPVPNGLPADHAALTEPMAVGLHAVNKSGIVRGEAAVVHGCGPVGLAVIAALKLKGIETIIAADFSPTRRALAAQQGATEVVDPRVEHPVDAWARVTGGSLTGGSIVAGGGGGTMVQFEAIGVPGILDSIMRRATRNSRITVVGVCMEPDTIQPIVGINKELNLQFVLGYTADEFASTLRHIAEGELDVAPLITGRVPLDGVAKAFDDLGNPEEHVKILVTP